MRLLLAIVLYVAVYGTCCAAGRDGLDQLRKEFVKPGVSYRALPMHFDQEHPAQFAASLAEGGWGGALFSQHGGSGGYLIDQTGWDKFKAAVEECKKRGLDVWIYDEAGYPSGRAGGQTLEGHPEYEARGLFYACKDVAAKSDQQVEWKLPEGTPFYVAACPLSFVGTIYGDPIDLTADAKEGVLRASIKQGDWRLVAFVENRLYAGTHAPITGPEPYINILDPDAVKRFIELTHERYYQRFGGEFGKTIKAFFTDEPSLQGGYLTNETQPCPAISWYHGLPDIFKARVCYDIRKALPALFNDAGPETTQYRCDFYDTISHAVADGYFKQIREWCEAHNVASTGHLLWEESLVYHASFYGSVFPSLAELDWPGIDVLGCGRQCTSGSHIEGGPVTPKLISSAAHIYVGGPESPRHQKRTMTESFCFVTSKTPMRELIGQVAWQWALGINSLTVLSIYGQYDNAESRKLNDFTGRVGSVLTKGDFVADVAVLYPIASVWADFVPTNRHVSYTGDQPKARDVDTAWRDVSRELLACQRDFDYLDEDAICSAKVSNGTIKIGRNTYRILVLPHATVLRLATLRQIASFVASGGTVISYKTIPSVREDAGPSEEFDDLVEKLWGAKAKHIETLRSLAKVVDGCPTADLAVSPRSRDIYYQHRALDNGDAYFLVNNADAAFEGSFTFRAAGKAQLWDPMTGKTKPITSKIAKGLSTIDVTVPGLSGVFVVFDRSGS